MKKQISKNILIVAVSITIVSSLMYGSMTLNAYSDSDLTNWYHKVLPTLWGKVTFAKNTREFTENALNKVTSVGGDYKAVNCWVTKDNYQQITDDTLCYEGQGIYTLPINSFANDHGQTWTYLLRGNNKDFTYVNVDSKGGGRP